MKCIICEKETDELCKDQICRECHITCSWDDCTNKTFEAKVLISNGLDRDYVKTLYPKAEI